MGLKMTILILAMFAMLLFASSEVPSTNAKEASWLAALSQLAQRLCRPASSRAPSLVAMASRRLRVRRRVETNDTDDDYVLNFDQTRFPSEMAANRFNILRNRKLIAERKVHLNEGEFANFNNEIMRRNWHLFLANPPDEIDDTLVREFYANTYQVDRDGDRQSMVRGEIIHYDKQAINTLLGTPSTPPGDITNYGAFRRGHMSNHLQNQHRHNMLDLHAHLVDAMMYMYAQNDALRRGQMCLMDNMHRLSLGIPDFPDDSVMTATQFEEHVPWPEDRPTFVRGRENQAPPQQPDEAEADQQGHVEEQQRQPSPWRLWPHQP
ncbi:uncharacterized protein HKW66_Vig0131070 [Vigna angularis]|uniref:Cathepsin propeptide inhibitor domain-containing protein n=1 Tax=Phaseolus angularis TaxID=3914 RepID=A0A8T0K4J5_PHAAN|nr:uncharacterized protein HKW66_Vig0131070 [Vigna angularis]